MACRPTDRSMYTVQRDEAGEMLERCSKMGGCRWEDPRQESWAAPGPKGQVQPRALSSASHARQRVLTYPTGRAIVEDSMRLKWLGPCWS